MAHPVRVQVSGVWQCVLNLAVMSLWAAGDWNATEEDGEHESAKFQ